MVIPSLNLRDQLGNRRDDSLAECSEVETARHRNDLDVIVNQVRRVSDPGMVRRDLRPPQSLSGTPPNAKP